MRMEEWVHKMCLNDTLESLARYYNYKIAKHMANEIERENKVYLAVDKDGSEHIFADKPYRDISQRFGSKWCTNWLGQYLELPKGSIKKLIGRELSFEDDPVELKN